MTLSAERKHNELNTESMGEIPLCDPGLEYYVKMK